jgi:hypothetical protein
MDVWRMCAARQEGDPLNRIYWSNLLTRERMYCQLCYTDAQRAFVAETAAGIPHPQREPWVRIADTAWFGQGANPARPGERAAYQTRLRAAFRRHVAEHHPVLSFEILWSR